MSGAIYAVKSALDKRELFMRKAYEALCLAEANALSLRDGQEDTEENPDPTAGILDEITEALDLMEASGCSMLPTDKRVRATT